MLRLPPTTKVFTGNILRPVDLRSIGTLADCNPPVQTRFIAVPLTMHGRFKYALSAEELLAKAGGPRTCTCMLLAVNLDGSLGGALGACDFEVGIHVHAEDNATHP